MSESAALRKRILDERSALGGSALAALSARAISKFQGECGIEPRDWFGMRVGFYRSMRGELDVRVLEAELAQWGARLSFPRVTDLATGLMHFAESPAGPSEPNPSHEPPAGAWPKSALGIEEPPPHHEAVAPESLDVIFVPGVVFGLEGERVGMGSGFYDRYLPLATRALRISLGFDFQLLPKIDQQPWDQRVDWIWTEQRSVVRRPLKATRTPG